MSAAHILGGDTAETTATAAPVAGAAVQTTLPLDAAKPADGAAPAAAVVAAADKTTPAAVAGEQKTQGGEKPSAKEGAGTGTPTPLALTFAEGVVADPKLIGLVQEAANKFGLSGEGAQKLADGFTAYQQQVEAARVQEWEQTQKGWVESLKSDKEFGGANFDKNARIANLALKRFDTGGDLGKWLQDTGFSNYPPLIRMLAAVGAADAEDTVAGTSTPDAKRAPTPEDLLRARYPNSPELK